MLRKRNAQIVCAAFICAVTGPASAQWFLDVYAGKGFVESTDVDIQPKDVPVAGIDRIQVDLQDVQFDDFTSFGLRVGHWFESAPNVGLALDIFRFAPDVSAQTVQGSATANFSGNFFDTPINVEAGVSGPVRIGDLDIPATVAVAPLELMLRKPLLTSSAFPDGRLRPYISAGPALLFTDIKPEVALGVKVGAGLVWQFSERISLFGEYRFTHFSPTVETGGVNIAGVETGDLEVNLNADPHFALAGLSYQFGE